MGHLLAATYTTTTGHGGAGVVYPRPRHRLLRTGTRSGCTARSSRPGQPGWAGFVPFYNFIVLLKVAGRPTTWGWFLLMTHRPVHRFAGILRRLHHRGQRRLEELRPRHRLHRGAVHPLRVGGLLLHPVAGAQPVPRARRRHQDTFGGGYPPTPPGGYPGAPGGYPAAPGGYPPAPTGLPARPARRHRLPPDRRHLLPRRPITPRSSPVRLPHRLVRCPPCSSSLPRAVNRWACPRAFAF